MRQQIPGKLPVETAKVVLPSVNPYRVIRIASELCTAGKSCGLFHRADL
jgi:hypothetical protein